MLQGWDLVKLYFIKIFLRETGFLIFLQVHGGEEYNDHWYINLAFIYAKVPVVFVTIAFVPSVQVWAQWKRGGHIYLSIIMKINFT